MAVALVLLIGLIALGAVLTWPSQRSALRPAPRYDAVVTSVDDCPGAQRGCVVTVRTRLLDGPDRGGSTALNFVPGATDPQLRVGQRIAVNRAGAGGGAVYGFADVHRGRPIALLLIALVVVAVLVGRARGVAALLGLLFAGAVLLGYLLPVLQDGGSPFWASLIAGAAIATLAMPLAHGVSMRSAVALFGSLAGMLVAAVVCLASLRWLHFTGLSGDETATLQVLGSRIDASGLVLCACVIGALGVLNDVTITQAGAVFELADAAPGLGRLRLTRAAMRIGRDHIASTMYSLVLAYAGASLPLLLLFAATGQSTWTVLTSDAVGPEVVSGAVGALSLALMVPVTTAIAAGVVARRAAAVVGDTPNY